MLKIPFNFADINKNKEQDKYIGTRKFTVGKWTFTSLGILTVVIVACTSLLLFIFDGLQVRDANTTWRPALIYMHNVCLLSACTCHVAVGVRRLHLLVWSQEHC